nr:hypothetical protein [uncultured Cetobacterium sp.]
MKKILITIMLVTISNIILAHEVCTWCESDVMERKIEEKFKDVLGNNSDVKILIQNSYANIEINYNRRILFKKNGVKKMAEDMATYIAEESDVKDIYVVLKTTPLIGSEKIIYTESFAK